MTASFSLPSLLRILMLGLLMAGILAKPVLAIACEIHDVQKMAASAGQAGGAEESDSDESCCSLPDCNDCCAHTTAVIPQFDIVPAIAIVAVRLPLLSVKFEPTAIAAAFRPPIRT